MAARQRTPVCLVSVKKQPRQVQSALPCLEAALVKGRLQISILQTGNQPAVVLLGAVFGHQLGADVEQLAPAEDDRLLRISCAHRGRAVRYLRRQTRQLPEDKKILASVSVSVSVRVSSWK